MIAGVLNCRTSTQFMPGLAVSNKAETGTGRRGIGLKGIEIGRARQSRVSLERALPALRGIAGIG